MKVRVRTNVSSSSQISGLQKATVRVGVQGPRGPGISDIDLTNLEDGAVLVYSTASGKWVAQTTLNKQQIDVNNNLF